eukprot:GFKZ01011393.1.p1 GENE.GFKZ01011393.1~~GFKZ01011393.1.p1  ORF type:complete len:308 (+),score=52.38 GFKZ01011393.1:366-1289(+)
MLSRTFLLFCSPMTFTPSRQKCDVCRRRVQPTTSKRRHRPTALSDEAFNTTNGDLASESIKYFDRTQKITEDPPKAFELPLFPLQMVLNPGTAVPLHIFEMRYRLLFNEIRDSDSRFGIVLYDPDSSDLALIGCAAELTKFEPLPDGRIITNNVGRDRFKIIRIIDDKPYTRAMVEYVYDDQPTEDLTELMEQVWDTLQDVLRLSNKLFDKKLELGSDVSRHAPGKGDNSRDDDQLPQGWPNGWPSPKRAEEFSFAINQVLDMPLNEQQVSLQTMDTAGRLRKQKKRLEVARQYLAAQVTLKEAGLE